MKRLMLALAFLTQAQAVTYVQHDFGQLGSARYQPLLMWCDGPDRVVAVSQPPQSADDQQVQAVTRAIFLKGAPNATFLQKYLLGPGDAGMGHIYLKFRPAGQAADDTHYLEMSNIARAGEEYTFNEAYFQEGQNAIECRYFWLDGARDNQQRPAGTIFAGASSKRSVFIQTLSDGTLEYRSFDYLGSTAIKPSNTNRHMGEFNTARTGLHLTGGKRTAQRDGSLTYTFRNNGYEYRVEVGPLSRPAARVVVLKGGRAVLNEAFRYYSDSRPKENP